MSARAAAAIVEQLLNVRGDVVAITELERAKCRRRAASAEGVGAVNI